jgi:nucleoside-diphosphate kinase
MKVRVLIILKPDCLEKGVETEVKKTLVAAGWPIVAEKRIEKVSTDLLEAHYNDVGKLRERLTEAKGAEFANAVIVSTFDYMTRGPIEALVIEREVKNLEEAEEAISYLRSDVVGATRPWQAKSGTIREMHGNKDPEHEPIENVVHCSGCFAEGDLEWRLWFPELA